MSAFWTQLWGMARYEMTLHRRRRHLLVIGLVVATLLGTSMLIIAIGIKDFSQLKNHHDAFTDLVLFQTWGPLAILMAFILPIMLADTIPIDHQHRMDEMWASLPITPHAYLLGKIVGLWLALLAVLSALALIMALAWLVVDQHFEIWRYLALWVLGIIPLALLNSALGVLVGASQSSRRYAVLLALAMIGICMMIGVTTTTWWDYVNPLRAPVIEYFLVIEDYTPSNIRTAPEVVLTYGIAIIELLALGLIMPRWMQRAR